MIYEIQYTDKKTGQAVKSCITEAPINEVISLAERVPGFKTPMLKALLQNWKKETPKSKTPRKKVGPE